MPLDHRAVPLAPVRAQRRPDREPARAPRGLGPESAKARVLADGREVRGAQGERAGEKASVADEGEAGVVRHVQPLVAVGDHRVGALDAVAGLDRGRRDAHEEAERAVDVQPCPVPFGEVGHRVDRIEVSGVHLTRVRDQDRGRAAHAAQGVFERREIQPSDGVLREPLRRVAADTEHRERLRRRRVEISAREHRDGGQAGEATRVDLGAVALGPPAAGRRERGEVRHRRAGGEDAAPRRREGEEVLQPLDRELLQPRAERRRFPCERVLVVGRRQPVRGERGGGAAADDPVEEPRTGRPQGRGVRRGELADRGERANAALGQPAAEGSGGAERVGAGDPIGVEPREVGLGLTQREPQRLGDETAFVPGVASTRRTRPAVR